MGAGSVGAERSCETLFGDSSIEALALLLPLPFIKIPIAARIRRWRGGRKGGFVAALFCFGCWCCWRFLRLAPTLSAETDVSTRPGVVARVNARQAFRGIGSCLARDAAELLDCC